MIMATRKLGSGGYWIKTTRLAIYLRDGCACAYCGASLEQSAQLSHVRACARRALPRAEAREQMTRRTV